MARYVVTVRTPRTPQAAFDYMADLRNFAAWDPGVVRVTQVEGSGGGPEASFDVVVKAWPRDSTLRYVTEQYRSPDLVVVAARGKVLSSVDRITTTAAMPAGCLVTYEAELSLNGVLSWASFLLVPIFKRIGDRAAKGLTAVLEGEALPS